VVTAESTSTLEALIKQRILDQAFDDVEAKVAIEVKAKKQRQDVSDERSKAGLGDIYEQDYVKEALGVQPTDQLSEEKQEMAKLFQLLTAKLDALTNYHFAPKPLALQDDLQVKSNLAALKMEEVTPAAVSDATLLAPEEVFNKKKAEIVSKSEMSKAEKKAKRAAKKGSYKKREAQRDAERKAIVRLVPAAGEKDAKKKAEEQLKGKSKAARGGIEKANEVAVRAHYYYCFPPPPPPPSTLLAAAAAATAIIMIIIARLEYIQVWCGMVWYG
jgi:U3 small nucleolar RNA-associated protein MPP10